MNKAMKHLETFGLIVVCIFFVAAPVIGPIILGTGLLIEMDKIQKHIKDYNVFHAFGITSIALIINIFIMYLIRG